MLQLERFLPGMNHILCGKSPKTPLAQMQSKMDELRQSTLSELVSVFEDWIPIQRMQSKANTRQRNYSFAVTFWAFLWQVINPETSCREVVHKLQSFCCQRNLRIMSSNTAAYCKARKRLDVNAIDKILETSRDRVIAQVSDTQRWLGHDVKVIDGTGIKLSDSAANQEEFPQPGEQREGCGFPVMKVVACFCLASGVLIDWVETNLKSHESRILTQMLHLFNKEDVILTDRGFCSYTNLAALIENGVHAVMRAHQMRKIDYRKGRKLGKFDRLVIWKRPAAKRKGFTLEQWKALPNELELRVTRIFIQIKGYRVRQYDLVSTLADANTYTREQLAQLYYKRWCVELYFRHIKTTMGMEKLRGKTPEMARKELRMYILAYNLMRALMQRASHYYNCDLDRISFKSSVDILRHFSNALNATSTHPRKQQEVIKQMIQIIASEQVPLRLNRCEPRALKERPKPYPRLTAPRAIYIVPKSRKNKGQYQRKLLVNAA